MASAVTRYLVTDRQVPLYKIRQIGLGNAPLTVSDSGKTHAGSIVEVTLMHNSLSTLSASNEGASTTGAARSPAPRSPPRMGLRRSPVRRRSKKVDSKALTQERTKADWPLTRGALFLLFSMRN